MFLDSEGAEERAAASFVVSVLFSFSALLREIARVLFSDLSCAFSLERLEISFLRDELSEVLD